MTEDLAVVMVVTQTGTAEVQVVLMQRQLLVVVVVMVVVVLPSSTHFIEREIETEKVHYVQ